ncbi:MAG: hypothetical protein WC565_06785 [Parcubacteria group bacterium]
MNFNLEAGLTRFGSGLERLTCGLFDGLGRIFEHGTTALSRVAIPVADLVVSYVAAEVIARQMGLSFGWALAAGIAMEGTGVLAAAVPLEQHRYNGERDKSEKPALEVLGWVTFLMQFGFGTVLIVMDVIPGARLFRLDWLTVNAFGRITLAVQSLAATFAAGLYADLKARERSRTKRLETDRREREKAKAERRAERLATRTERQATRTDPVPTAPVLTDRQAAIVRYVTDNPFASLVQIGEAVGTSKTTAQGELAAVGYHKNGHGWEVR